MPGEAAFLDWWMMLSHRLVCRILTLAGGVSGGRSQLEGPVESVPVVVLGVVAGEALGLTVVPDDGAVEEFAADRADPSFGERVGNRSAEDLEFRCAE